MEKSIVDAKDVSSLGDFSDPQKFNAPLNTSDTPLPILHKMYRDMLVIRLAEEAIGDLVVSGDAKCPCHLGIGQEAVAVGISQNLRASDSVYGAHRSHSHYLALGGRTSLLFAEILGKDAGCSKGMGGSMHLFDPEHGFHGSVPIVGATIPIAVGSALAHKMDGSDAIAVTYFGDGSTEEGVFHESLNLASHQRLPVLFVCENNGYSSHLDIKLRQPTDAVSRFAVAHRIPALVVDGNDVIAVARAAMQLVQIARTERTPVFIEAVTYRWRGHVGPDENIDVGLRRKSEDLVAWKSRDPIKRLACGMTADGQIDAETLNKIETSVRDEIRDALAFAKSAEYPPITALLDRVYAGGGRCDNV